MNFWRPQLAHKPGVHKCKVPILQCCACRCTVVLFQKLPGSWILITSENKLTDLGAICGF